MSSANIIINHSQKLPYEIVEYLVAGKKDAASCEDYIVANEYFVAVVDGATSKSDVLYNQKTGGKLAAELVANAILHLPFDADVATAIATISNSIKNFYVQQGIVNDVIENPHQRLTAVAAIYSVHYKQVWIVGDCQCIVNDVLYKGEKYTDTIAIEARALYNEIALAKGTTMQQLTTNDVGRAFIIPLLKEQCWFQNHAHPQLGYPVFDGFDINLQKVKVLTVVADTFVLATDGYPKLMTSLQDTEDYLKHVLDNDPLCIRLFKSTKGRMLHCASFDDRAYIKIKGSPNLFVEH